MLYSISIVVLNNPECTQKCLEYLVANTTEEYELIISDNGSDVRTREFLRNYRHPNCRIIYYSSNTGFGWPHNEALKIAKGDYFVVLNNDIYIHEKKWLTKLCRTFKDNQKLAISGFSGNQSYLNKDGVGDYSPNGQHDYVEASCLMMPRVLALRYGLFSDDYELAYYEDVDLSLRYRQMGFHIELVPAAYDHVRYATSGKIDPLLIQRILSRNKEVFFSKWSRYFERRFFTGKILIKSVCHNALMLLQTTPILKILKDAQPLVKFDLMTNMPEVFMGHPAINTIYTDNFTTDTAQYDRIIEFDFSNLDPERPAAVTFAKQAGVRPRAIAPLLIVDNALIEDSANRLPEGMLCALSLNNNLDCGVSIRGMLNDHGYVVLAITEGENGEGFLINGRHYGNVRAIAAVIANCQQVVGEADSFHLHIAQALNIPTITLLNSIHDLPVSGLDLSKGAYLLVDDDFVANFANVLDSRYNLKLETSCLQNALYGLMSDYDAMWRFSKSQISEQRVIPQPEEQDVTGRKPHNTSFFIGLFHSVERIFKR